MQSNCNFSRPPRNAIGAPSRGLTSIALLFAGCASNLHAAPVGTNSLQNFLEPPVVAAHRGGYFEQGSPLDKIKATLSTGSAQVLEMDLRLTRDGVVIVAHDGTIQGSGQCTGPVDSFTYDALSACQLALDRKPTTRFADVLDAVRGRAVINAEFKTAAVIAPAIGLVKASHASSWVYFQATGDLTKYRIARQIDEDVALLLKVTSDDEIRQAIALHDPHLVVLEMDRDFVTAQRVARVHAAGLLVSENSFRYQFTAERFTASCDHTFSLGVDIAVTNNASSCAAQRGAWISGHAEQYSSIFDRQHLRADFRGNKRALELFALGLVLLLVVLAIQVLRWSRRRTVARAHSLPVHA